MAASERQRAAASAIHCVRQQRENLPDVNPVVRITPVRPSREPTVRWARR